MKAKPQKLVMGEGYVDCFIAEATHVTICLPGPVGQITLPVILKGTREGTNSWSWNGSVDAPTLRPSVLVQSGHCAPEFKPEDSCWCKYYAAHPAETPVFQCFRCHTWINDGHAQFLPDSTHTHAGQTLALLDVK